MNTVADYVVTGLALNVPNGAGLSGSLPAGMVGASKVCYQMQGCGEEGPWVAGPGTNNDSTTLKATLRPC